MEELSIIDSGSDVSMWDLFAWYNKMKRMFFITYIEKGIVVKKKLKEFNSQ